MVYRDEQYDKILSNLKMVSQNLDYLNENCEPSYYSDLGSKGLKRFIKRIVWKAVKFLLIPLLKRQQEINANTVCALNCVCQTMMQSVKLLKAKAEKLDCVEENLRNNNAILTWLQFKAEDFDQVSIDLCANNMALVQATKDIQNNNISLEQIAKNVQNNNAILEEIVKNLQNNNAIIESLEEKTKQTEVAFVELGHISQNVQNNNVILEQIVKNIQNDNAIIKFLKEKIKHTEVAFVELEQVFKNVQNNNTRLEQIAKNIQNNNEIIESLEEKVKQTEVAFVRKSSGIEESQYKKVIKKYQDTVGTYMSLGNKLLQSSVCRPTDLLHYGEWVNMLQFSFERYLLSMGYDVMSTFFLHRKLWEYVYIAQALSERGMLVRGKKGLGFAVGTEPLPALFARYGCKITATDLDIHDSAAKLWISGKQHTDNLTELYRPDLCGERQFYQNVCFQALDMNNIPPEQTGYDFCWSSCAFEHLGSIEKGKRFIQSMMHCLKPGGIAVHTTEYNLSSNDETLTKGENVIYRRRDFEEIAQMLAAGGHVLEPLDFRLDGSVWDTMVTVPPYEAPYIMTPHFKLLLRDFVVTSFGLIIRKADTEE